MKSSTLSFPKIDVAKAAERVNKVALHTPLALNQHLSRRYQCNVYLKREDLQVVRSYKIRGAYNMMCSLPEEKLQNGVVCASAGNHAQGFAYSCKKLNLKGEVALVGGRGRFEIWNLARWKQANTDETSTYQHVADVLGL